MKLVRHPSELQRPDSMMIGQNLGSLPRGIPIPPTQKTFRIVKLFGLIGRLVKICTWKAVLDSQENTVNLTVP